VLATENLISLLGIIVPIVLLFCALVASVHSRISDSHGKISDDRERIAKLEEKVKNLEENLENRTTNSSITTNQSNLIERIPINEFRIKSKNHSYQKPVRKRKRGIL